MIGISGLILRPNFTPEVKMASKSSNDEDNN